MTHALAEKTPPLFYALLIFGVCLGLRLYWLEQKTALHLDESLSFTLSFYKEYGYNRNFVPDRLYSGKEAKSLSLYAENSLPTVLADLQKLHADTRDDPHPNLYYSLLRLSFLGTHIESVPTLIVQGVGLNIVLFSFSFWIFFLFLKNALSDYTLYLATLLVAFSNPGSISTTLLIREYQLQETLFLLLFFIISVYVKQRRHSRTTDLAFFFSLSLSSAIALLSGYFAIIFTFSAYLMLALYYNKRSIYYFLTASYLTACLLAVSFYPKYLSFLHSTRAAEAAEKLALFSFLKNGKDSFFALMDIFSLAFSPPLFLALLILFSAFLFIWKKSPFLIIFPLLLSIFWSISVTILAPYKISRYISPVFPLLCLLIPASLIAAGKRARTLAITALCLMSLASSFLSRPKDAYTSKYLEKIFQEERNADTFMIVEHPWEYSWLLFSLPDGQKVRFPGLALLPQSLEACSDVLIVILTRLADQIRMPEKFDVAYKKEYDRFTLIKLQSR